MFGQTLTILCQGLGIPTPVVILKQNGTIIYSEHHPQKHNITLKLTVHKLSSTHSGNYSCSMRNQLGSVEQQKYVVIKGMYNSSILILHLLEKYLLQKVFTRDTLYYKIFIVVSIKFELCKF